MSPILRLSILLATLKLATVTLTGAQDISQDGCDARLAQGLPYFLAGVPSNVQEHTYRPTQRRSDHTATGSGLHDATVGQPASFTIQLFPQDGDPPNTSWNVQHGTFIYVWIANKDQILIADVVNNGDGSLTATYESSFPGEYLITVEAIIYDNRDEGMPIKDSPFALTIVGDPTLDIEALPACSAEDESVAEAFWKPGTWVSSNIASAKHGVTRDGWVFQPKTCVHDTFSYDELMLLASLNEPTWLLVLGGSIQRGIFLTLVDMILAQGQKDDMYTSAIQKCWGYADVTVGNLRVTYQDMRLWRMNAKQDSVQCDNEKLVSGSTSTFLRSARDFLKLTVFKDGQTWPTAIFAPSFVVYDDKSPNTSIEVLMGAMPKTWQGVMLMVDHMSGYGVNWRIANPTRTALNDVGIALNKNILDDSGIERLESYRQRDPRVKFLSAFPMHQAKLFENQGTKRGVRQYGGSQHYHYVANGRDDYETYNGAKMVHSTVTEMLSHITIAAAVGTKAVFYKKVAATPDIGRQSAKVRRSFEVCTDCPSGLLPFHVKPVPDPECETLTSLLGNAPTGKVWDNEFCPDWCMATDPVDKTPTESGMVDVRVCDPGSLQP